MFTPLVRPVVEPVFAKVAGAYQAVGGGGGGDTFSVTVTDIASNRVVQRNAGATQATMTLTGTYSGSAPSSMQARLLNHADDTAASSWASLGSFSASGGNWQGTFNAAQGGPYKIQTRVTAQPDVIATGTNPWLVGIVIVGYGQSNMLFMVSGGMYAPPDVEPPPAAATVKYFNGTSWVTPTANGIVELLNGISAAAGVPVGGLVGGQGGVGISALVPSTENFTNLTAAITAAGGGAEFIVWHQGEGNLTTSAASYAASLSEIHEGLATHVGRTTFEIPLVMAGLGRSTSETNNDVDWDQGNRMLLDVPALLSDVYYSHANPDVELFDNFHWLASSYGRAGQRYARSISTILGITTGFPNFSISGSETVSSTQTDVSFLLTLGTDIAPSSGITGFEVSGDNGASWISATGARLTANSVRLTHSAIATSSLRKLRYLYGKTPDNSALVKDNSSLQIPVTYSAGVLSPTPLSAVPVPTHRASVAATGSSPAYSANGITLGSASGSDKLVVIGVTSAIGTNGNLLSVTATPNSGSPVSATLVQQTNRSRWAQIFQVQVSGSATSCDFSLDYGGAVFNIPSVHVWTIPVSDLVSTTAVDSDGLSQNSATSLTFDIASSADGCMIFVGGTTNTSTSSVTTTGSDESYVERARFVSAGFTHVAFDASSVAASAANTVTLNISPSGNMSLVAVSYR